MPRAPREAAAAPVSLDLVRQVLFRPLEQETAVDAVAARIRDAASLGVLGPGERLPAETDLARQLDIGVMTLRAALAELREEGLLETRRGRTGGSFVRGVWASRHGARRLEDVRELLEVRAVLEGGAARLATANQSPSEVFGLEVLADWLDDPARADKRLVIDAQFHMAIAEMTRNRRLVADIADLRCRTGDVLAAIPAIDDATDWGGQHRDIVDAIVRRDPEAAEAAMRVHIEEIIAAVARAAGDAGD